ncbi:MAG: 16S rRNA (uracil(1498)-N(3))-methyltransferase [Zetaproteobacteria bacterium]|nr:MAG: 16S rRNA (uracil(1498)-N(3))-methyltransferase [Zetaproteobacteria bacterium]
MLTCRLYIQPPLTTEREITLDDEQGHYLRHVMRLRSGDPVILFDGKGGEYEAIIHRLEKSGTVCHIGKHIPVNREMSCKTHIIQAACRSEKIEVILQKGTELGAASFQIVRTERSALKLIGNKLEARLKRWRKIIIEAAEQSGRTRIPLLHWRNTLAEVHFTDHSYAMHPLAAQTWTQARQRLSQAGEIDFIIGPEGGLSKRDLDTLTEIGCHSLAFGPCIMRTETAAPALLAAIQAIQQESVCA